MAEVDLAAAIIERTPVEQVRLVNSGTEATMSVLRLARGITGRNKIIKFAGCYHGHVDALLAAAGSGVATLVDPRHPGGHRGDHRRHDRALLQRPGRRPRGVRHLRRPDRRVITEAAAGNMGVIPPGVEDGVGFNAFLADIAREHGALFISDEVMTGFRVSRSGQYGLDGVRPDLMTFGKVMGGGFPAAAFGGRADLMQHLAPVGGVYQAGTLSGNPVATAAGLTTLRLATHAVYAHIDRVAEQLQAEVAAALTAAGVAHVIQARGNLFSVFFVGEDVTAVPDYAAAARQSTAGYSAFFHAMLDAGVYLPPSAYEGWFWSAAHDDGALERIVEALPAAAAAAARPREADERADGSEPDGCASGPARRGRQPRRAALRPAARLPPVRAGPGDGPAGRRGPAGPRHRAPALLAAGAGAGDHGSRSPKRSACR